MGPSHTYIMTVSQNLNEELAMDVSARTQVVEPKFARESNEIIIPAVDPEI